VHGYTDQQGVKIADTLVLADVLLFMFGVDTVEEFCKESTEELANEGIDHLVGGNQRAVPDVLK
jgi:hypothetical protein